MDHRIWIQQKTFIWQKYVKKWDNEPFSVSFENICSRTVLPEKADVPRMLQECEQNFDHFDSQIFGHAIVWWKNCFAFFLHKIVYIGFNYSSAWIVYSLLFYLQESTEWKGKVCFAPMNFMQLFTQLICKSAS